MKKVLRKRPSPAMMVALLSLFVALGGSSYAAIELGKYAVDSRNIAPDAVTRSKIANEAVDKSKIAAETFAALKGKKGAAGDTGPAGPAGADGATGPAGATGPTGPASGNYSFRAVLSADESGVAGGSLHVVGFDSEVFDTGADFTPGPDANYTAPFSGKYLLGFSVYATVDGVPGSESIIGMFSVNGSTSWAAVGGSENPSTNGFVVNASTILSLTAGDVVRVVTRLPDPGVAVGTVRRAATLAGYNEVTTAYWGMYLGA